MRVAEEESRRLRVCVGGIAGWGHMPKSSVPYVARIYAHSGVGHKKVGPLSQSWAGSALQYQEVRGPL